MNNRLLDKSEPGKRGERATGRPAQAQPRRRGSTCFAICALLGILVGALELAGYHRQGLTMQLLLIGGVTLAAILAAAWAAGKARQALLLYTSCAGTLVLVEVALRIMTPEGDHRHRQLFCFDKKLGWRWLPDKEEEVRSSEFRHFIKTNSAGFRDREYPSPNGQENAREIAILGDSMVANPCVGQDEVFTEIMHKELQPRVAVRNFGVNGYSQVQELLLLEELLLSRKPGLVALVVCLHNDFTDNLGNRGVRGYKRPSCRLTGNAQIEIVNDLDESDVRPEPWSVYGAITATRLYKLTRQTVYRFSPAQIPEEERPDEISYCKREWGPSELHALQIMKALLHKIARRCAERGCPFAVVLAPSRCQVEQDEWKELLKYYNLDPQAYDRSRPNQLLKSFCAEWKYPCLDLLPSLEGFASQGEHLYHRKDLHWNAQGNLRVAETLLSWIRQNGF